MTAWMEEKYRTQMSIIGKLHFWMTWQKRLRYERWLFSHFERCAMVSESDRQAVKRVMPEYGDRVAVIPNGVDLDYHHVGIAAPVPNTLIFNGALSYFANYDAMEYFLGEIFPIIRGKFPGAQLTITGSTKNVNIKGLPGKANVVFTGFLEDIRPAVASAWACVVPLRLGAGTRLKILEAMALGTPVVSTSKGAEGLNVTPEENILIADTPTDFAVQTIRLLGDPALRARLSKSARALVEAEYGWQAIGEKFVHLVESVVNEHNFKS